jgi:hypothetical protein
MLRELTVLSTMEVRYRLIRPREFDALASQYLPAN